MQRKSDRFLIFLCAALVLILAAMIIYQMFPAPYGDIVEKYSSEYGVDQALIYAVIKAESNFDVSAVSSAGAKGLAQLTDETAQYLAEKIGIEYSLGDSFKVETNIRLSAYYLKYLMNKYDSDLRCTIAAYNAGEGNVDKWLSSPDKMSSIPFGETDRYLKRVRFYRKVYSLLYGRRFSK